MDQWTGVGRGEAYPKFLQPLLQQQRTSHSQTLFSHSKTNTHTRPTTTLLKDTSHPHSSHTQICRRCYHSRKESRAYFAGSHGQYRPLQAESPCSHPIPVCVCVCVCVCVREREGERGMGESYIQSLFFITKVTKSFTVLHLYCH